MLDEKWYEYGPVDYAEVEEDIKVEDDELTEDELLDGKTKKDDDIEEDDSNDDDDEEDEDSEEELTKISFTDIKTKFDGKYKELFKDIPQLKPLFFKAQEFEKRFSNLEDADEAIEKNLAYDEIKEIVVSGNVEGFLENLKEFSPKSVNTFAESFLPDLAKFDEKLYIKVTKPVIQDILNQVLAHGKDKDDTNIQNAAKLAHKIIFGTTELGKPEFKNREKDEDLENDKSDFLKERQQVLVQSVTSVLNSELEKEILKGLDPTDALKERAGLKKRIIKEIKATLDEALANDAGHMARMNGLWARERTSKYSGKLKDSITTAYLSRAKALIPKIRSTVRQEYLGIQKKDDKNTEDKINGRNKDLSAGRASGNKPRMVTVDEARKKGMTDKDIIG